MVAIKTDHTVKLILSKRYLILDLDPAALGLTECKFNYLVQDENEDYVWVNEEYLTDYIAK